MSAVEVKVSDAANGEPLEMATVYLVPVGDTTVTAFGFTDKKGTVLLNTFAAGKYIVNVQSLGFKPYAKEKEFPTRMISRIPVSLEEDLEMLKGASVTAMGDLVTVKGDTLTYNATSFHTGSNDNLGDLLKKMPGIEVNNGRVSVNGEPVSRITVEGKTFFFNDQSKALENLPAFIVNKINVFDKDNDRADGGRRKRKEMDVRLKEEYKEAWFEKVSAEGGASIRNKSSNIFDDNTKGLYNAKVYAQYYGDDDTFTVLGGGNNVNKNQLASSSSGMSDVASAGVNYSTSRIPGYDTRTSGSYDFRNSNNRSESHRTSYLSSGEQLETKRSKTSNAVSHSAKANLSIGAPPLAREGFTVSGKFNYNGRKTYDESMSSTTNSNGEELNGSESRTTGSSNNFSAKVMTDGKYYLDRDCKHQLRFEGNVGYDGNRGNSRELSTIRLKTASEDRGLLYADKSDDIKLYGILNYSFYISRNWELYSSISADYRSSWDDRDANNAADGSRNEYYSKLSTDRQTHLRQNIQAHYNVRLGEKERFGLDLGVNMYEDNLSHASKAYNTGSEYDKWQFSAGPDLSVYFQGNRYSISFWTRGNSVTPPPGASVSTVPDYSNPVDISIGNIYLRTGYHQDARLSFSRGGFRSGGSYIDIRLTGSADLNEVTYASWYDPSAVRYSIPVNTKRPSYNADLYITYIQPLNHKKSLNLTFTPKANYRTGTLYVANGALSGFDKEKFDYAEVMKWLYGDENGSEFYSGNSGFKENRTQNLNWSADAGLKYELKWWSLRVGASVVNSRTWYSATPDVRVNTWTYKAYAEALWHSKGGWEAEGRFEFRGYSGYNAGYNRPDWLLNLRVAKEIKAFTLSFSAYDILGNAKSFSRTSTAEYVEDTYRNTLGRCILVGLSYNFGSWDRGKASRANYMEKSSNL